MTERGGVGFGMVKPDQPVPTGQATHTDNVPRI